MTMSEWFSLEYLIIEILIMFFIFHTSMECILEWESIEYSESIGCCAGKAACVLVESHKMDLLRLLVALVIVIHFHPIIEKTK